MAAERNAGDYDRRQTRNLNPHRDEIGLAGEAGFHIWLTSQGLPFSPFWKDNRPGPDFGIEGFGLVDVKSQTGSGKTAVWNGAQYLKWRERKKAGQWCEDVLVFAKVDALTARPPAERFRSTTLLGWKRADAILQDPATRIIREGDLLGGGGRCSWTCIEIPSTALRAIAEIPDIVRGLKRPVEVASPPRT